MKWASILFIWAIAHFSSEDDVEAFLNSLSPREAASAAIITEKDGYSVFYNHEDWDGFSFFDDEPVEFDFRRSK